MFYDEETSNAKYVLKYFVDVKMFYFETTLLDNLQVTFSNGSCDYETLINAVTVRCAPHVPVKSEYVPIKKLNISPIKIEDIPGGVRVFSIAHTYCGKGDPSDNPMQYRPVQIPEHRPALAQQSDTQHIQNALVPPHLRNGSGVSFKDESVQRWATSVIGSGIAPTPGGLPNTLRNMPNGTLSNTGFQGGKFSLPKKTMGALLTSPQRALRRQIGIGMKSTSPKRPTRSWRSSYTGRTAIMVLSV